MDNNNEVILLILVFLLILGIVNFVEIYKIKKRYKIFKSGANNENMEVLLQKYIEISSKVQNENISIEKEINSIKTKMLNNVQKIGITKYNAFSDMSSNLSFSVAILDGNDNGVILTELYSRNTSTLYIRKIENGLCDIELSSEEKEAIEKAQKYITKK